MKTLLITGLLFLIYVPVNSEASTNETDPFTKHLLSQDNPCEDEMYLELKEIDLEEMSERQYEVFKSKDKSCQEYRNLVRSTASQDSMAESMEKSVNSANTYYVIAGITTVISLIYIFTI